MRFDLAQGFHQATMKQYILNLKRYTHCAIDCFSMSCHPVLSHMYRALPVLFHRLSSVIVVTELYTY